MENKPNRRLLSNMVGIVKITIPLLFILFCAFECGDNDTETNYQLYFYVENKSSVDLEFKMTGLYADTIANEANSTSYLFRQNIVDSCDISHFDGVIYDIYDSVCIYQNDVLIKTYQPGSAFYNLDNWDLQSYGEDYAYYYTITEDSLKNWE